MDFYHGPFLSQIYHIKTAVTDYEPTDEEKDALPLVEGEKVEVLDTSNPDRWLCRLFEEPDKQGWVPPSYLMEKVEEKMSTQETFREEVLKTKDKTQQATMRRRFVLIFCFKHFSNINTSFHKLCSICFYSACLSAW